MPVKSFMGVVESLPSLMTAKVKVIDLVAHPRYKKIMKRVSIYLCHYTDTTLASGDPVVITETKPISKRKKWLVTAINKQ